MCDWEGYEEDLAILNESNPNNSEDKSLYFYMACSEFKTDDYLSNIKIEQNNEIEKILALAQHLDIEYCLWNEQYFTGISQEDLDEKEEELLADERYSREEINEILQKWIDEECTLLEDEFQVSTYDDNRVEYGSQEYLVCTDSEADDLWEESLDSYLEHCVYPELTGNLKYYFDDEKWKRDAKMDGRGHSLSRYDGNENEEKVGDTWYYIYRIN